MNENELIRKTIVAIIKEAGEKLKEFRKRGFTSHSKGTIDFATDADDAIDAFLRERLQSAFPQAEFLTEETAPEDYQAFATKQNLFIIDPIDGTTNFARGSDHCAISVGLVDGGKTRVGVVYLPFEEKLYYAQNDVDGAFLNDETIRVSSVPKLTEALILCDWSWDLAKRQRTYEMMGRVIDKVRAIESRGTAAGDIASVASGSVDGYFIYGLKPWDISAALLIAEKAGAKIESLDGSDWSVFSPDLLITNAKIHEELRTTLHTTERA